MRPEYESDKTIHTIADWQEASATSQEWAVGARQAALKRKRGRRFVALMLVLLWIIAAMALVLFLTGSFPEV